MAGTPLLGYTLELISDVGLGDRAIVSSDDPGALELAARYGVRGLVRPPELATATASTESALLHVLDVLDAEGEATDWVVTLPPTSPFRRVATFEHLLAEVAANPDAQDCLMTVTEDRRDLWRMGPGGHVTRLFPAAPRRQQDRTPLYEENSAIYVTRVAALRRFGTVIGGRVRGVVIDAEEAWDINTETDFAIAEALRAERS